MKLTFSFPRLPLPFEEEFFLGGWHPDEPLQLDVLALEPTPRIITGPNWFLVGPINRSSNKSLVHDPVIRDQYLNPTAFRGYLVDPPIHTWSESNTLLSAWNAQRPPFNGSFAAVRVLDEGREVEMTTDVLGISPLYYREVGKLLLFATNSRFLYLSGDELDQSAGRNLIQSRFAWGDSGLTFGVRKVSPGVQLNFSSKGTKATHWFDYSSLPLGDEPITNENLQDLENSFRTAIDRILRLRFGAATLPLSGGNDSRRILSAMVSRKLDFVAYSVRVFHDGRDMDASFAGNLARHFGFPQKVIELPRGREFAELDRLRRVLVDGEGVEHTWWLAMGSQLGHTKMLFDGLAGDITSYSFYNVQQAIGPLTAPDNILRASFWPSPNAISELLENYLAPIPKENNRDTLAFLFLRTRTGPGLMATRLLPLGNLAVFPFMDLDYLRNALRFDPAQKATKPTSLQQRCLRMFWPEYANFPTTASNPPRIQPMFRNVQLDHWIACLRELNSDSHYPLYDGFHKTLTFTACAKALMAPSSPALSTRFRWWLEPFLTLVARQQSQRPVWSLA